MCGRYNLTKFASFLGIDLLCAEIVTTFGSKKVTISARNTIMRNIFQQNSFDIFQPNFGILLLLKGSSREFRYFLWICLYKKLVYNANGALENSTSLSNYEMTQFI